MSELLTEVDRYRSVPMAPPDAIGAAASYVDREYGAAGYRLGLESTHGDAFLFRVRCSDGGEFHLLADRYGNVVDAREGDTFAGLAARLGLFVQPEAIAADGRF